MRRGPLYEITDLEIAIQPKFYQHLREKYYTASTHPFDPNKAIVISGRANSGKTSLALMIADTLLRQGTVKRVILNSLDGLCFPFNPDTKAIREVDELDLTSETPTLYLFDYPVAEQCSVSDVLATIPKHSRCLFTAQDTRPALISSDEEGGDTVRRPLFAKDAEQWHHIQLRHNLDGVEIE